MGNKKEYLRKKKKQKEAKKWDWLTDWRTQYKTIGAWDVVEARIKENERKENDSKTL